MAARIFELASRFGLGEVSTCSLGWGWVRGVRQGVSAGRTVSDATHDRSEQLNSPCATRPAPHHSRVAPGQPATPSSVQVQVQVQVLGAGSLRVAAGPPRPGIAASGFSGGPCRGACGGGCGRRVWWRAGRVLGEPVDQEGGAAGGHTSGQSRMPVTVSAVTVRAAAGADRLPLSAPFRRPSAAPRAAPSPAPRAAPPVAPAAEVVAAVTALAAEVVAAITVSVVRVMSVWSPMGIPCGRVAVR